MLENYFTSSWSINKLIDNKKDLLAPCGLYCGVCRIYQAYKDNDLEFKKEILPTLNDFGAKTVDDIACTGCLSDGEVFPVCRVCAIKKCTNEKGIDGCHECSDFPCKFIENFPIPVGRKVIQRTIPFWQKYGTERFIEEEERRYHCPACGNSLFRGAKRCNKCKIPVDVD